MAIPPLQPKRVHVAQGEYRVLTDPEAVLTTVLGSCVAACLRDPVAAVGGMNHFLLPGASATTGKGDMERYGVHLMELLINGLLQQGAQRTRLEAKIFGGARMLEGLSDIGARNAEFAKAFLRKEGIALVSENLGGTRGRRVEYYPVSGRARQILLAPNETVVARIPEPSKTSGNFGAVELF